jgi:hypothetical protein
MVQRYAVPAAILALVTMAACSSGSQTALAPSGDRQQPVSSGTARHTMSTSGSGGGSYFKLVYHDKVLGGECQPSSDLWSTPDANITIPIGAQRFEAFSTMVLPDANNVTFTNSTFTGFTGNLVVSSSNTSYSPVGTWAGLVWTPPSAGTYYAGYEQDWSDTGNGDCAAGTVYGPGTATFTWSQP